MRTLHLTSGRDGLFERDQPRPYPQQGEVLIRVRAAGVTRTEIDWYPTSHTRTGEARTEAIPVHEFSGEIAALGADVTSFTVGQPIYGLNDWFDDGALAEYCITKPEWIASKPSRLTHAEAASVPIGALTAWQGLFEHAKLQPGERILIHGGSGAVGIYAIQLARRTGARVITTVSAHNIDFVRELGADEVIDYKAERFEQKLRDLDVVFDGVGGETLDRSWQVLQPNGRMVTIAADSEGTADERIKSAFFIVEPRQSELVEFAKLIDAGEIRVFVDAVLPFDRASEAFTGKAARSGRGKVVIQI